MSYIDESRGHGSEADRWVTDGTTECGRERQGAENRPGEASSKWRSRSVLRWTAGSLELASCRWREDSTGSASGSS